MKVHDHDISKTLVRILKLTFAILLDKNQFYFSLFVDLNLLI